MLGTTTRTLRYYEELGLVSPSRLSASSQRKYGDAEIARLVQIRELQTLVGLELEEIAEHLQAFDRLDGLRAEYLGGAPPERRSQILDEGMAILERLRAKVSERQERLAGFAAQLDARVGRYRAAMAENSLSSVGSVSSVSAAPVGAAPVG